MTLTDLIMQVLPVLVATIIMGGLGVYVAVRVMKVEFSNMKQLVKAGFDQIHKDIEELKNGQSGHEDRIRNLEISQARREGKESAKG